MPTVTEINTIRQELNRAQIGRLTDLFSKIKLGNMMAPIKVTVAALTASATPDITSPAVKAAATIVGRTLLASENLPAIGQVVNLRISASGTAASVGTYGVTDAGGTAIIPPGGASASMGIAKLSDDGKTITFPNTVTGFVITYYPRAAVDPDTASAYSPSP